MSLRLTRLELALVALVFATGLGLRAAYPSRMAVEHFDEGVYASNLYTPEGRYPFQHLYAPPLLPFCLEWAAIFGGPHAVMWVNVVSGSLTVLVLWGMVREWWGPPAAIAAMVLLAFNEFHIAYSRAALTDAMLGLWMTAGVWAGWRAVQRGGVGNILAAGALASLAWWTKYNGWLTLAITGSGTAGWMLFGSGTTALANGGRDDRHPFATGSAKRTKSSGGLRPPLAGAPKMNAVFGAARVFFGRWLFTSAIALLLWAPWLWSLQQYGGYSAVSKNHAGYFTGLSAWWDNAVRQTAAILHYQSPWKAAIELVLALSCAGLLLPKGDPSEILAQAERPARELNEELLAGWIVAAYVLGLLVAIPLYSPYPRLCVPLVIGLGLAAIGLVRVVWRFLVSPARWSDEKIRRFQAKLAGAGRAVPDKAAPSRSSLSRGWSVNVAMVLIVLFIKIRTFPPPIWQSRTGMSEAAEMILSRLGKEPLDREVDGVRCVVSVVAEPGLFFHLAAAQSHSPIAHVAIPSADCSAAAPGGNMTGLPVYLIVGPHADAREADRLIAAGRLESVAEFEYRPSDLVLLDSRPAWDLPLKDQPVVERIRLLHVKP